MNRTARNYGIDLLRIFSIFLVVVLHILGHGGGIAAASSRADYSAVWLLEIFAYPAVNCFVIITGFVGFRGGNYAPRLRNIVSIFFTVIFYSVGICVVLRLIDPSLITLRDIKNACLPLLRQQYWFYSSYFGVFLLSPILNFFVYKASAKQLYITALTILFFSVSSLETSAFELNSGYTMAWFVFLYLLGASMKKCDIASSLSIKVCVFTLLAALLLTWLPKVFLPLSGSAFWSSHADYFIAYTSPTVLLMAICWVCIFSRLKVGAVAGKIISFFAASAFSVYLIHDNMYIRKYLMRDSFRFINEYHPVVLALVVIGSAVAILTACTLIDKIRILLFKLLRLPKLAELIERAIKAVINKSYRKICSK